MDEEDGGKIFFNSSQKISENEDIYIAPDKSEQVNMLNIKRITKLCLLNYILYRN